MALRKKYQGDDIKFLLKQKDSLGNPVDLSMFEEIVIYAYTDRTNIVKLSTLTRATYYKIVYIDDYTYEVLIPSVETKDMKPGVITIEINLIQSVVQENLADEEFNTIKIEKDAFQLYPSIIKAES